jgi:hypothetical protein
VLCFQSSPAALVKVVNLATGDLQEEARSQGGEEEMADAPSLGTLQAQADSKQEDYATIQKRARKEPATPVQIQGDYTTAVCPLDRLVTSLLTANEQVLICHLSGLSFKAYMCQ